MNRLIDDNLKEYLVSLGSKIPSPGGGSVVATVLCSGISLYKKCLLYSSNNFKKEDFKNIEVFLGQVLERALGLIDRDKDVYLRLNSLIKNKSANKDEIQKAYYDAASAPLEMARLTVEALSLIDRSIGKIKKIFVSDLIVVVSFLEVVFDSALVFVKINSKFIDESFKDFAGFNEEEIKKVKEDFKRIKAGLRDE